MPQVTRNLSSPGAGETAGMQPGAWTPENRMSYQVLARKWRPQNFDELVGQESIARTLRNALKSGRLAHAFLFSGIRGVGKTTVARILAMAMNCRRGISENPCGECESCIEIRNGNSVDVQEIDAASNRGIDNIRELNASVRYGTARDRFRIYIVDEVHMLTNEAFNALLKTLEEPPPHVKFILATTEFHKVPATIASRCQKYEFHPIPFSAICQRLRRIAEAEQVTVSDYALSLVATAAQGSMRDAQSALDKLLAFGGDRIEDEDVRALLGVIDQGVVAELIDAVGDRDRQALIQAVHRLVSSGVSPQVICGKLIERVRHLLVFKTAGWNESVLQLPDSQKETLERQAGRFSSLDLIRFYDVLHRTQNDLRWHSQPAVHLEITLLKLVELAGLPALEEVLGRLGTGSGGSPSPVTGGRAGGRPAPPVAEGSRSASPVPASLGPPTGREAAGRTTPTPGSARLVPVQAEVQADDDAEAGDPPPLRGREGEGPELRRLLEELKQGFRGVYESLQMASRITLSEGRLRISFPKDQEIWAQMLERGESRNRLSEALARITGDAARIEVSLDDPQTSAPQSVNPLEDPKVKQFLERFPGRVSVRKDS
ncbi:MAG: hypothetical protein Kow001_02900 [Acidobacteriota bacterium]